MPSLTFATADATATGFTVDPAGIIHEPDGVGAPSTTPLSGNLVSTGIGSWELTLNLSYNGPTAFTTVFCGPEGGFVSDPFVEQTFSINFARLSNPIPDGARITKLTYRKPKIINVSCTSIPFSGPPGTGVTLIIGGDANPPFLPAMFSDFPGLITEPNFASPRIFNQNVQGTDADIVLFDIAPAFITKAQLIALWSNFDNSLVAGTIVVEASGDPFLSSQIIMSGTIESGSGWVVTVEYEEALQWNVSQDPSEPIDEGSTVSLVSNPNIGGNDTIDFTTITQIDILVPDYNNPGTFFTVNVPQLQWTLITPTLLQFIMPNWPPGNTGPTVVQVVLTGTQFSGTVARQLYTIFLVSASGIYELVPGKTTDTLYIEEEPGETIDVKIPNPFGRTGFFGK